MGLADIALYNEWKAISKQEDQHTYMTTEQRIIRTTLLANCLPTNGGALGMVT